MASEYVTVTLTPPESDLHQSELRPIICRPIRTQHGFTRDDRPLLRLRLMLLRPSPGAAHNLLVPDILLLFGRSWPGSLRSFSIIERVRERLIKLKWKILAPPVRRDRGPGGRVCFIPTIIVISASGTTSSSTVVMTIITSLSRTERRASQ